MTGETTRSEATSDHSDRANISRDRGKQLSWPHLVSSGALLLAATRGGLLRGALLSGAGAAAAYRGIRGQWPVVSGSTQPASMHATLTINKSAEELFDLWRDLESLPNLIPHVEDVAAHGRKSKWEVSSALGGTMQWEAEITLEERPRRIEWKTTDGSSIPMVGMVEFHEPAGDRGTEVRVEITPKPPGGKIGAEITGVLAKFPEQQLRRDLRMFKQKLEAGEIPTTAGQPRGDGTTIPESRGTGG